MVGSGVGIVICSRVIDLFQTGITNIYTCCTHFIFYHDLLSTPRSLAYFALLILAAINRIRPLIKTKNKNKTKT